MQQHHSTALSACLPCPVLPGMLLIGTGDEVRNVDPIVYDYFRQRGVSVEVMATVRDRSGSALCELWR